MTAARPLTIYDQMLINLCGWLACMRIFPDPNLALMLDQTRRVIPHVSQDHPLITPLAEAAAAVVEGFNSPISSGLARARLELDAACQAVFMARTVGCAVRLWPEENSQPGTEEPAHAAE